MNEVTVSRRDLFKGLLASVGTRAIMPGRSAEAAPAEIKLPDGAPGEHFDFETKGVEGWTTVEGQWTVEEMPGAPRDRKSVV